MEHSLFSQSDRKLPLDDLRPDFPEHPQTAYLVIIVTKFHHYPPTIVQYSMCSNLSNC